MSAAANAATFFGAAAFGGVKLPLLLFERCVRTAADTIFFTNVRAATSDFMSGESPPQLLPSHSFFRLGRSDCRGDGQLTSAAVCSRAGAELTVSASRVAMAAGIGVLLGPLFSSRVVVPLSGKLIAMRAFPSASAGADPCGVAKWWCL